MDVINHIDPVIYQEEIDKSKKKLKSEKEDEITGRLFTISRILNHGDYNTMIVALHQYLHGCTKKRHKQEVFERVRNHVKMLEETPGTYTGANANAIALWMLYEEARGYDLSMDPVETFEGVVDNLREAWEYYALAGGNVSAAHVDVVIRHANQIADGLDIILNDAIHNVVISDVMCGAPMAAFPRYIGPAKGKYLIILNRNDADDDFHLISLVMMICEVLYNLVGQELEGIAAPLLNHIEGDQRHFEGDDKEIITLLACGYCRKGNFQCGEDNLLRGMLGHEYGDSAECATIVNNLIEFVGRRVTEQYLIIPEER